MIGQAVDSDHVDRESAGNERLSNPQTRRIVHLLAWGTLLLALGYLASRGIWRGIGHSTDLTYEYSATQAWLHGLDPYDPETLRNIVRQGGGPVIENAVGHPVYFPAALPIFLPIALGSWQDARLIGLIINVAAALFIAWGMTRLVGWRPTEPRALVMMAFFLALAPVHTTIAFGQTANIVTAALVGAMLLERSGRGIWAGVMYGLATATKVSMGLPFVAYLVWRRRWVTAGMAGLMFAALTVISVARMQLVGITWLEPWLANLAWLTGPTGNGSPSPLNTERTSLINLEYLLYAIAPGGAWASLLTFALVGLAGLVTVWLIRGRHPRQELLALSVVAVLGLLLTYHRYYDAVLLAIPIAWAFWALRTPERLMGAVVLGLCALFMLPIQTTLNDLQQDQHLPSWLTGGPLWGSVLLTLHVWALVIMVPIMLWAAARTRRRELAGEFGHSDGLARVN